MSKSIVDQLAEAFGFRGISNAATRQKAFDESSHPRHPEGDKRGGQFAPKGGATTSGAGEKPAQSAKPGKAARIEALRNEIAAVILAGGKGEYQERSDKEKWAVLDKANDALAELNKLGMSMTVRRQAYGYCESFVFGGSAGMPGAEKWRAGEARRAEQVMANFDKELERILAAPPRKKYPKV